MFAQDPQPQVHTGERVLSQEEYCQGDLDSKISQYHKQSRDLATHQLREIAVEPTKRRNHGKEKAELRPKVQAKKNEEERKESQGKSVNHRRNIQATLDRNSLSPSPVRNLVKKEPRTRDRTLPPFKRTQVTTNPPVRVSHQESEGHHKEYSQL